MTRLLDQYGQPIQRKVLGEAQTARIGWVTRAFAEHPSRGLTPARLHRVLEEAEQGVLSAQADLFTDMEEKDGHIFAEMSKRKRVLLTLDWSVEAPPQASAAEKTLAGRLQEWLENMPELDDVLLDCLDGIGHGFAALEIQWQQLGREWLPERLSHRPQRWFQTLPTDGNALRLRDGTMEGAELWPFGWVLHQHRAKSGYLTRAGLHRILCWPYLFKNYAVRDLAEFLEIYGLPLRVGKYPSGATDAEKATLLQAVAGIGHNAAGIIPEGMLIEFQEAAKGSHDPFQAMMDWCERTQSKAILGGTLTSQADGKTSTNALGQIHNEVRHDLTVSDARQLEGTLTRDLLYPLAVLNAGQIDPRRLPRLVFDTRAVEDMASYADSLPKLVGLGLKVPVSWVRDKLAIPAPAEDEEVLSTPRPELALPPALRPQPKADKAALHYRAVLRNSEGELVYPDQQAIDDISLPQLDSAVQQLLAPLISRIQSGEHPDSVLASLATAWPELDDSQLQQLLAQAIFVADVWGRLHGDS
ncbi:DUF935 domain-containing protein [Aquitalea palustris]|uniref:DUF935 domain-containing protein n=1 Tax=Aquitalea palustris TaxID=2480983 RepID=A0A454JKL5_9NEIS|nr:DUF935 domain-containing protein [Aquitalea palustris]RMC99870.1 DUF935 domain-containing protein [Aquitalea palustris]